MTTQHDTNLTTINCDGSLTESDLLLLQGSDLITEMLRNRILVIREEPNGEIPWATLCENIQGFYHIKAIESKRVYQIWFQLPIDKEQFEKNLMMSKLA